MKLSHQIRTALFCLAASIPLLKEVQAQSIENNQDRKYAYTSPTPLTFNQADAVVAGANLVIGCAFGAIPSAIRNHNLTEIIADCGKGAVGGSLIYAGEKAASISSQPGLGWIAHTLVSTGSSIQENVAADQEMLNRFSYYLGPLSIGYETKDSGNKEFRWYIMPTPLIALAAGFLNGDKFNVQASLYNGTSIFDSYKTSTPPIISPGGYSYTFGNVITIQHQLPTGTIRVNKPQALKAILDHEMVHAVTRRELGIGETALRAIPTYAEFSDTYHLSFGTDLTEFVIGWTTSPLEHNQRPFEWVPHQLADTTGYHQYVTPK